MDDSVKRARAALTAAKIVANAARDQGLAASDAIARAAIAADDAINALLDRVAALQQFKDFVHARLDAAGVPPHPNGPHTAEGCRIGDRLDLVLKDRTQ